jgi:hypothetical protein
MPISLRCGCGTPINLFKGLKDLTDMDELMEAAHTVKHFHK